MKQREALRWPLFAATALMSGAALLLVIYLHLSLGMLLLLFVLIVGVVIWRSAARLPISMRSHLKEQVRIGLLIGFTATVAYDLTRFLFVTLLPLRVHPFETFLLFGYAIIGSNVSPTLAFSIGTAYHYVNGLAFAIAYCLILGGQRWLYGVGWALVLEAAMLTVYPGWLDLRGVMAEFTLVSIVGHLAYGSTLGLLSQRWFRGTRRLFEVTR